MLWIQQCIQICKIEDFLLQLQLNPHQQMDNLVFISHSTTPLFFGQVSAISYEQATKTLLVVDQNSQLYFLTHNPQNNLFYVKSKTEPIEELESSRTVLLQYLVESDVAFCVNEGGDIFTVEQNGTVDLKAKNDDGITGGSVSPTQQYIYLVTNNNTLIQLDMEFDLVKQMPLDDSETEKVDAFSPSFSWKVDGSFFSINIQTDKGRKCHTRDHMMGIFRSASKSDPTQDGLVQSVSEKSRENMSNLVAWQPTTNIIAGSDYINRDGKKINRVIFWEKNGLRHLEFQIKDDITDILNLVWTADSKILLVQALSKTSERILMFYHRANYYWYLKQTLKISQNAHYSLIKHKYNSLILVDEQKIQVFSFDICLSPSSWKTQQMQEKFPLCPHYVVDGNLLKITDFSKSMIPPPMCLLEENFTLNIVGVSIKNNQILVITNENVCVYSYEKGKQRKLDIGQLKGKVIVNLQLIKADPLVFTTDNQCFTEKNETIVKFENEYEKQEEKQYRIMLNEEEILLTVSVKNEILTVNGCTVNEHCTSYLFYHEFFIFTSSSTGMYDKMFVFNLFLDKWIYDEDARGFETIQSIIEEKQNKKTLNFRSVERGAKIITCSKNRVIFQLPRGNLEGIYPKLITINCVKKAMNKGDFKFAFETIRTHKLDLNLLYDLNPKRFEEMSGQILSGIKKVDYINLFASQVKDTVSQELQYCLPTNEIEEIENDNKIRIDGKKVIEVCKIISKTLRQIDKQKYILSIFTSEIKMGLLNQVLKQIKQLKEFDHEVILPPHIDPNQQKKAKKLTSQEILEYVCWLVDANVIYEAALLTYDLDLASLTARCTQMDPKQYIPYIQSLKQIKDQIQLRKKICLDLKKYDQAIHELAVGGEEEIAFAMDLVKKHKLFKVGLKVFKNNVKEVSKVKKIMAEHLLQANESNQAYSMYRSIGAHQQALKIGKQLMDGQKIIESIEGLFFTEKEKKEEINKILEGFVDETKNKNEIAVLYNYVEQYKEALEWYLKAGNYQKAYSLFHKVDYEFAINEFQTAMSLLFSLHKNLLIKEKNSCLEKFARLQKVHKHKRVQGESFSQKKRENDDMYSEVSVSSKTNSSYTISTTTGMRRKKDKKRSILSRNVKEGSPLEEEYLIAFINDIKSKVQANVKQSKIMIQYLIYVNMVEEAESLRNITKQYIEGVWTCRAKIFGQVKFEEVHPQAFELYRGEEKEKQKIDSFNYLF